MKAEVTSQNVESQSDSFVDLVLVWVGCDFSPSLDLVFYATLQNLQLNFFSQIDMFEGKKTRETCVQRILY